MLELRDSPVQSTHVILRFTKTNPCPLKANNICCANGIIELMVWIAWENKLLLGLLLLLMYYLPNTWQNSYTSNKKTPNRTNEKEKGPNCALPMLIFLWWHFMWGTSATLHTQKQKQTLFSKLTVIQPRLVGWESEQQRLTSLHGVVSDVPGREVKGCDPIPHGEAVLLLSAEIWLWKRRDAPTLVGRISCLNLNVFDDTIKNVKLRGNYYRKLLFQLFQQNFSTSVHLKAWNKATGFRLSQFT